MSDVVIDVGGEWRRVPGHVWTPENLVASAALKILVKGAGETLERHYPGWRWVLRPDEGNGILDVTSLMVNTDYAWTLHIPTVQSDPTYKCVVRAGGEYLERFGFARGPYDVDKWMRIKPQHGQFMPKISDWDKRARREANTRMIRNGMYSGHIRVAVNDSIGEALQQRERELKCR